MISGIEFKKNSYAGLFLISASSLMYEILLTRFFSVTMWYHFAFLAISIAMFGMTLGALLVYLFPNYFNNAKTNYHLTLSAFLFGIFSIFGILTHLSLPFSNIFSFMGIYTLLLNFIIVSLPFVFSGINISLALTRNTGKVGVLYAFDLIGAALGCFLVILTLSISDGPTAMIIVAVIAGISALFYSSGLHLKNLNRVIKGFVIVLTLFAFVNTYLADNQQQMIRIPWVKGQIEHTPLMEKWNSFSRVTVSEEFVNKERPFGWGFSWTMPDTFRIKQLMLLIDAGAGTILTKFDGDLSKLQFLKYDLTNLVNYTKTNAQSLIIGAGGGRDILSALLFGQKSVTGLEINDNISNIVNNTFGQFTGNLNTIAKVKYINEEARSYLTRSNDNFDIIQVSLVDTWAATSAGAYILSENAIYTKQAWQIFLNKLNNNGILNFSRWYSSFRKAEMYRVASLASESLIGLGIKHPEKNIYIASNLPKGDIDKNILGIGTILVSKTPFPESTLDILDSVCNIMNFNIIQSPRLHPDNIFNMLSAGNAPKEFYDNYPLLLNAPTDDNPYFFYQLKLKNIFKSTINSEVAHNKSAIIILGTLLMIVVFLTILCILIPLYIKNKRMKIKVEYNLLLYFGSIGFGFMLLEISQMQKLMIFLGNPIYGLSVVLSALLLSTGIGSLSIQRYNRGLVSNKNIFAFVSLLAIIIITGFITPMIIQNAVSQTNIIRIALSIAIIFPMGIVLGIAFPIGMEIANSKFPEQSSWFWGINGATSVTASVISIVISILAGIQYAYWTGVFFYTLAFASLIYSYRKYFK